MIIIEDMQDKIDNFKNMGLIPKCIIISWKMERQIFTDGELPKNTSIEDYFKLPVILFNTKEILIGI
tara:strand:- start:698 stop:898 length:201 start_codon:yes stop_codon:yes gene_type:complete